MKIKEFLENFNGNNHIIIYDSHDFSTHRYNHAQEVISAYRYFTVKSWNIVDGVLKITIRSQF